MTNALRALDPGERWRAIQLTRRTSDLENPSFLIAIDSAYIATQPPEQYARVPMEDGRSVVATYAVVCCDEDVQQRAYEALRDVPMGAKVHDYLTERLGPRYDEATPA